MMRFAVVLLLVVLHGAVARAAEWNTEWLAKDRDHARWIVVLLAEHGVSTELVRALETEAAAQSRVFSSSSPLGLGASLLTVTRPGGYARVSIQMLLFRDSLVELRLSVNSLEWELVGEELVRTWIESRGSREITVTDSGVHYNQKIDALWAEFSAEHVRTLGPLRRVHVPRRSREVYEDLLSPYVESSIGTICGIAGTPPYGAAFIQKLIRRRRVDILTNLLREYSPSGRVWAVIGLREIEARGQELPHDVHLSIRKVLALDVPVPFCQGCLLGRAERAEIVERYLNREI